MELKVSMCHCHLLWMLAQPKEFERAIEKYEASTPQVSNEGMAGYMLTNVVFTIRDIKKFAELYRQTVGSGWYHKVRRGALIT